jgi:hypothetical protein
MNIEDILKEIPDKFQHPTTTSHKFKKDVYNFFNKPEFKELICVEWGSNIGYSTRLLSYLFKEVVGFNKERIVEAQEFNATRSNIRYFAQDIYNTKIPIDSGDVFFVDADHSYHCVIDDTMRSLKFKSSGKKYFIFDDYGADPGIKKAVTDLIEHEQLMLVQKIGHSPEEKFIRKLYDYEGVICTEFNK